MLYLLPVGDVNERRNFPYVNTAIIAVNVLVFLAVGFRPDYEQIVQAYGFVPAAPTLLTSLTAMFLHADILHLIGNMLFLWIYGDNVEDKFTAPGYLAFYLAGGMFADFIHGHVTGDPAMPCIGASGAISAVMGAYVFLFPHSSVRFAGMILFRTVRFELPAWLVVGWWFVQQLLSQSAAGDAEGVAYAAHVGGFIGGAVFAGALLLAGLVHTDWRSSGAGPEPTPIRASGALTPVRERGWSIEVDDPTGPDCPACLKAMVPVTGPAGALDHCRWCGGLWMDPGETERVLALQRIPAGLLKPNPLVPGSPLLGPGYRKCPRCQLRLVQVELEGVEVEGCKSCGGLWLDRGRLQELRDRLRAG